MLILLRPSQARRRIVPNRKALPSLRFAKGVAKAVPVMKILYLQWLIKSGGAGKGGNKVLLTILTRQNLPTVWLKERFH